MARHFYDPWQGPTYPDDQDVTEAEKEALARAASMARAQSPGPLVCQIDGTWSIDDQFHADPFKVCMDFRRRMVVADNDPWTYWQTIDGPLMPPKQPTPPLPDGIMDWQVRAVAGDVPSGVVVPIPPPQPGVTRVWATIAQVVTDATGMPQMDGTEAGWNGWTFAVYIDPSAIKPLTPAYALRLTLVGSFTLTSLLIAPADPGNTWLALNATMYPLAFGGEASGTATMDPITGLFNPLVTDPLTVSIDPSSGLWIAGYFDAAGDGLVGSRTTNPGWGSYYAEGNWPGWVDDNGNIDFSWYTYDTFENAIVVLMVEGLFDPVQLAGVT